MPNNSDRQRMVSLVQTWLRFVLRGCNLSHSNLLVLIRWDQPDAPRSTASASVCRTEAGSASLIRPHCGCKIPRTLSRGKSLAGRPPAVEPRRQRQLERHEKYHGTPDTDRCP